MHAYRNQKKSELDQEAIEMIARQTVEESGNEREDEREDAGPQTIAESSLCKDMVEEEEGEETGDETRLLGPDDLSSAEASRTSSLFITNPATTANDSSLVTVDLSSASVETERGVSRGEEGGEEMVAEVPAVTLLTPTVKKRNKYLAKFVSAVKNLLSDLGLFFW